MLGRQLNALPELADEPTSSCMRLADPIPARVDVTLFRQVLVESHPQRNRGESRTARAVHRAPSTQVEHDECASPTTEFRCRRKSSPRMFDPYVSTKTGKDNMGLGLAIVKKIVLEHGGDIRYEERDGHPEFVITLPVLPA